MSSPKSRLLLALTGLISSGVTHVSAFPRFEVRANTTSSSDATGTSVSAVSVSTVIASPTASLNALLPSQVALPPHQAWCPSEIFCAGEVRFIIFISFGDLFRNMSSFSTHSRHWAKCNRLRLVAVNFDNIPALNSCLPVPHTASLPLLPRSFKQSTSQGCTPIPKPSSTSPLSTPPNPS